jgi:hypothetical protein
MIVKKKNLPEAQHVKAWYDSTHRFSLAATAQCIAYSLTQDPSFS